MCKQLFLLALLLVAMIGGSILAQDQPIATTGQSKFDIAKAYNEFGLRLLVRINQQQQEKNIFISPASIAIALAMTYNGAAGETAAGIAKTLGVKDSGPEKINAATQAWQQSLQQQDAKVQLTIANSLWARAGIDFNKNFIDAVSQYYQGKATTLDFASPQAVEQINSWVNEQTRGKIDKIIENIPGNAIMFLLNAIYFKGEWQTRFDKNQTHTANFFLTNGQKQKVKMMVQAGKFQYLKSKTFKAVQIPYGKGDVAMYVFLPNKGSALKDLLAEFATDEWQAWHEKFSEMEGDVVLPRFQLKYEVSLNNFLSDMGMALAFDSKQADFSKMRPIPPIVFIQSVKHKTFVEVNEEGAEAAAVTSIGFGVKSIPIRFSFIVNRPFFFTIYDKKARTFLFLGSVYSPK